VVDQGKLTLSIYSGEYLPILFSQHGIPQVLSLSPDDGNIRYDNYCDKSGDDYVLRMPFVLALKAGEDRKSVADSGRKLLHLCSRMHQNVSSRVSCEYIFSLSESDKIVIMAGVGSAQTFRRNFYYRLAEAFCNFEWLHKAPEQFPITEYRTYEQFYLDLKKKTDHIPSVVEEMYQRVKRLLTNDSQKS
jgi:hypothetical protein